jgi:ubiquinone/menaquinone biosynthesis C-methylase UbiE
MTTSLRHGDYTHLAESYSRFRPGYSDHALAMVLALFPAAPGGMDAVDVGAGTGIWSRMLAGSGLRSVTAVEPNDSMRGCGERDSRGLAVTWRAGRGEATGLTNGCCDLVTMASSFHWVEFDAGMREFHRILRPGGRFAALWNPRVIEANPLLVEIEGWLTELQPELTRKSSGRSGLTDRLSDLLDACPLFEDLVYLEARHVARQTPAEYLGVWSSVNDVQVQLGPERWRAFLDRVEQRVRGLEAIETTYLTRLWTVRRR